MNFHPINDSMLVEMYAYDPRTGIVTRKTNTGNAKAQIGSAVGNVDKDGYLRTRNKYRRVQVHRLAWFLYYGKWPEGILDHINGNRVDNRIENLREATQSINSRNRHNKGGSAKHLPIGISQHPKGYYVAGCRVLGRKKYRTAPTIEEATRLLARIREELGYYNVSQETK